MPVIVRECESTAAETAPLDIVVPYTTPHLTRLALRKAEEMASAIHCGIRVVRLQAVPFPLDLRNPPVALSILREQTRQVARGIQASEIAVILTRDPEDTLIRTLSPSSIVVIASEKRWWRTAQERLKRICERHGHQVALFYRR
jgi:hypothetical protein